MKPTTRTLAVSLLAGVFLFGVEAANAQSNSPPSATATRPAEQPQEQSVPNNAPPATTTQTTGEAPRDPIVKQMNEKEKDTRSSAGGNSWNGFANRLKHDA
jgi:hypothetical protein